MIEPSEESLSSRALEGLPRAQTIEALLAFNEMKYVFRKPPLQIPPIAPPILSAFIPLFRDAFSEMGLVHGADCCASRDRLKAFLEPFRDGGRVVSAEDIGEFMQSVKGAGKAAGK